MKYPNPHDRIRLKSGETGKVWHITEEGCYVQFDGSFLVSNHCWSYDEIEEVIPFVPASGLSIKRGTCFDWPMMIGSRIRCTLPNLVVCADVYQDMGEIPVIETTSRFMEVSGIKDKVFFINRLENLHIPEKEPHSLYRHGPRLV